MYTVCVHEHTHTHIHTHTHTLMLNKTKNAHVLAHLLKYSLTACSQKNPFLIHTYSRKLFTLIPMSQ